MGKRKTVGFLVDFFTDDYQAEILKGINKEAFKQGINLVCYCGGPLNSPESHHWPRNAIYNLIDKRHCDGLVIMGATIGNFVDMDRLYAFYSRFAGVPIVSVGADFSSHGIVSVLTDNSIGMKKAVEHFIVEHGFRRIAFIRGTDGNKEAVVRFEAYKSVLEHYGIPYDPDLVCPGHFYFGDGKEAVRLLLDERKARFDAIIGSNDLMAIETMRELQKRGINIPRDVAVIGFDDIEESKYISPPLTSVRQPLYTIGEESVKTLATLMAGGSAEPIQYFPTEICVRASCGCFRRKFKRGAAAYTPLKEKGFAFTDVARENFRAFVSSALVEPHTFMDSDKWAEALFSSFVDAVSMNDVERFADRFTSFVCYLIAEGHEIFDWQIAFKRIVEKVASYFDPGVFADFANELAGRISGILYEHKLDQLFAQKKQSNEFSRSLYFISIELITTFNIERLTNIMETILPDLGIHHFYIVRYVPEKPDKAWKYLSYRNGRMEELPPEKSVYDRQTLLLHISEEMDERFSVVIMALYFKEEQIGYVIYDIAPLEGLVYESLTIQLSSTLMGSRLVQEVEETQAEVLYTLGDILERRSIETGSHVKRVAEYSYILAKKYGINEEDARLLRQASPMHDIGKLGIEDKILNKPAKLTPEEYEEIKKHTTIGYNILKSSGRKLLRAAAIIAHQHHEYWDGTGYPRGLAGEEIHIFGRITCIADVFDALGSERVYKSEWPVDKICEYIRDQSARMFDPKIVELFFANLHEILLIRGEF